MAETLGERLGAMGVGVGAEEALLPSAGEALGDGDSELCSSSEDEGESMAASGWEGEGAVLPLTTPLLGVGIRVGGKNEAVGVTEDVKEGVRVALALGGALRDMAGELEEEGERETEAEAEAVTEVLGLAAALCEGEREARGEALSFGDAEEVIEAAGEEETVRSVLGLAPALALGAVEAETREKEAVAVACEALALGEAPAETEAYDSVGEAVVGAEAVAAALPLPPAPRDAVSSAVALPLCESEAVALLLAARLALMRPEAEGADGEASALGDALPLPPPPALLPVGC